jgi:hypothetical protein
VEEREVEQFAQLQVHATAEQQAGAISEVLDSMSNTLRIPLILRDMDGLSYEEIARSLRISLSAATRPTRSLFHSFAGDLVSSSAEYPRAVFPAVGFRTGA